MLLGEQHNASIKTVNPADTPFAVKDYPTPSQSGRVKEPDGCRSTCLEPQTSLNTTKVSCLRALPS